MKDVLAFRNAMYDRFVDVAIEGYKAEYPLIPIEYFLGTEEYKPKKSTIWIRFSVGHSASSAVDIGASVHEDKGSAVAEIYTERYKKSDADIDDIQRHIINAFRAKKIGKGIVIQSVVPGEGYEVTDDKGTWHRSTVTIFFTHKLDRDN